MPDSVKFEITIKTPLTTDQSGDMRSDYSFQSSAQPNGGFSAFKYSWTIYNPGCVKHIESTMGRLMDNMAHDGHSGT